MKIPGYTIIRELGSGGMATVYLARQDRLTRDVALKVMKPIAMTGGDFTSRFVKEGQIIAQLQHPQIVTIYDFDSSDGYHYFSMEYLPGGTVADEIKRGMPASRAIGITKRIAEALAVAHARGVIHRDVKPQNILFRSDGTPVLTDFGIARAVTRDPDSMQLTSYGMVIGSPRYMSPEQSTGQPLDARSDLYSLGVVFYEMLTEHLPYEADDVVSLAMKHCNDPIPRLPRELSAYQPILDKLIAKKPDDRFASAGQLIRALESLETTTSTLAEDDATRIVPRGHDTGPTAPPAKPARRRKRDLFALIGIILVLGIGAVIIVPRINEGPRTAILAQLPAPPPNRPETAAQYEDLAIRHLLKSELDSSLRALQLGLAITPNDARLMTLKSLVEHRARADRLFAEAQALRRENQLPESLAKVEEALTLMPGRADLTALKAELEQAIDAQRARRAEDLLARARAAMDANQLDEARRLADEGLALVPDHSGLLALKAEVADKLAKQQDLDDVLHHITDLIAAEQLEQARDAIDLALGSHPRNARLLDLRESVKRQRDQRKRQQIAAIVKDAKAQLASGNHQQALALVEQGFALDPEDADLKQLKEGIQAAQDAERQRRADDLLSRALAAFDKGDRDTSLALVEEGLKILPTHAGLSELRERIRDIQAKLQQIAERLADCDARFPPAELTLANALDAHACYQQILALEPANARAASAVLALGDRVAALIPPLLDSYRLDDAEAALARLQRISPDHAKLASLQEDLQRRRDVLPEMVDIRGGCFEMGSPESEEGRELDERQHRACVEDFQLGRFEVTVKAFATFVKATGYRTDAERGAGNMNGCEALDRNDKPSTWGTKPWASWRKPNKYQATGDADPVSCVSWNDAMKYLAWLNKKTSRHFRLPSEAEWEFAARAGSTSARFWGDASEGNDACLYSNSADKKAGWAFGFACGDGQEWVAPVGSLRPNPWGLFDLLGNVWEWTCSEYDAGYRGNELLCAPATLDGPRVMRGGAWNSGPALVRCAYRNRNFPESRFSFVGFRLAHDGPAKKDQD